MSWCNWVARTVVSTIVLVLVCVGTAYAFDQDDSRRVVIGNGQIGRGSWLVLLEAAPKAHNGFCETMLLTRPEKFGLGLIGESYECEPVSPEFPVVKSIGDGSGSKVHAVFAIIFDPSVRKAVLNFGARGRYDVTLKRVSLAKAEDVGIPPVAYWTHGFAGHVCLRRLIAYDETGAKLSDSGHLACHPA
jgi:hypothetical protein